MTASLRERLCNFHSNYSNKLNRSEELTCLNDRKKTPHFRNNSDLIAVGVAPLVTKTLNEMSFQQFITVFSLETLS
jgi:hypothetical protein